MEQLIWFSMPGAVWMLALWLCCPGFEKLGPGTAITLLPVTGFFAHQSFRTLFELFKGWESPLRPVIREIQSKYGLGHDSRTAFLIWEVTFYSEKIPASFRDHDRGAWHYVMSFLSVAFVAALATLFVSGVAVCQTGNHSLWMWASVLVLITGVFALKGILTARSLCHQECSMFKKYSCAFEETARALIVRNGQA